MSTRSQSGKWLDVVFCATVFIPHLSNCFHTPLVCPSTPSTASINTTAPSTTRLALSTSMPKSTCPGVSIKLKVQSFHFTGILADWIVMPRSRSADKKSVVVLPVSTDPGAIRKDDACSTDSVKVVLPESVEVFPNLVNLYLLKLEGLPHQCAP